MLTTDREIEPEDARLRERQRETAGAAGMTAAGLRWLTWLERCLDCERLTARVEREDPEPRF